MSEKTYNLICQYTLDVKFRMAFPDLFDKTWLKRIYTT